jgi:hypothetical protein
MNNEGTAAPELDPKLTDYIVLGNNNGWGRAKSEAEAIELTRSEGGWLTEFVVFRCTPRTYVNELGGFNRPMVDPKPVKVGHHHVTRRRES